MLDVWSRIRDSLVLIGLGWFTTVHASVLASGATLTYEVPKGELLEEAFVVTMNRARFHVRGSGQATLDYELPPELDGTTPHRFKLTGIMNNGEWELSTNDSANQAGEPSATAKCLGNAKEFTCVMRYAKNNHGEFPLDIDSANAYLNTRTDLSPAEIANIKQAQFALAHEPIGIIRGRK